jgi:hypothetical protein
MWGAWAEGRRTFKTYKTGFDGFVGAGPRTKATKRRNCFAPLHFPKTLKPTRAFSPRQSAAPLKIISTCSGRLGLPPFRDCCPGSQRVFCGFAASAWGKLSCGSSRALRKAEYSDAAFFGNLELFWLTSALSRVEAIKQLKGMFMNLNQKTSVVMTALVPALKRARAGVVMILSLSGLVRTVGTGNPRYAFSGPAQIGRWRARAR